MYRGHPQRGGVETTLFSDIDHGLWKAEYDTYPDQIGRTIFPISLSIETRYKGARIIYSVPVDDATIVFDMAVAELRYCSRLTGKYGEETLRE